MRIPSTATQCILVLILLSAGFVAKGHSADPKKPSQISQKTVDAWKGRSLSPQWLVAQRFLKANSTDPAATMLWQETDPSWKALPMFVVPDDAKLEGLPAPEAPFGLSLSVNALRANAEPVSQLKRLTTIRLTGLLFTPETLPTLKSIPGLTHLEFSGLGLVTAEQAEALGQLSKLQHLTLGCAVTDKTFAAWKDLKDLTVLTIHERMSVTGRGIDQLPGLKYLNLQQCKIEDAGLEAIGKLPDLEALDISYMQSYTNDGLAHLKPLKKLSWLRIEKSSVTDAGLKQAADLPALTDLNLRLCQVSDAGLAYLQGKKTLRRLVVNREQFSEAALAKFRQAVPKCELIQE